MEATLGGSFGSGRGPIYLIDLRHTGHESNERVFCTLESASITAILPKTQALRAVLQVRHCRQGVGPNVNKNINTEEKELSQIEVESK